ncbi:H-type small acid-soluble spore protein [Bacillus sp. J33]|uniref:H-type small acid-soluble spore protein n=1 Tax=Bacillus sp. J33 TaxID=935836 RepID=UPI00047E41F9|nr:H-type small acid-soluble spore protein [Bacillus sp. J33]
MNIGRAKEISESAEMVGVTYNGNPVIIQHVDEQTKTARIYTKADPENEMDVPVNSLIEE